MRLTIRIVFCWALFAVAGFAQAIQTDKKIESSSLEVYPNPVTSKATVSFNLKNDAFVKIDVLDITGRKIKTTASALLREGANQIEISREGLASGIYVLRILKDKQVTTTKLVVE